MHECKFKWQFGRNTCQKYLCFITPKKCLNRDKKSLFKWKGRGAIRADFGPMSEINFVVVTI